MSIPTRGEEFSKLIEYLRRAQESAAILAHLEADTSTIKSKGWLAASEGLKLMQKHVTDLATKGFQ